MATTWFVLLALIFTAYAVLDGFDLGVGAVYQFVARTDQEHRACLAAIGPIWSGNEVWLLAGGGSLFFSFPRVYAVSFSGFYLALMVVLWLLIVRGIALEFQGQWDHPLWRAFWKTSFTVGSILLTVLLGVALGNLVRGLPLDGRGLFQGSFSLFIGGYSVLVGVLSAVLLSLHGSNYLAVKTEGALQVRARSLSRSLAIATVVLTVAVGIWSSMVRPDLLSPFQTHPVWWILPGMVAGSLLASLLTTFKGLDLASFLSSAALIAFQLASAAVSLYPDLLHSTVDPAYSLTVTNAAASAGSLKNGLILIGSALVLVVVCQVFVYRKFLGKVAVGDTGGHY